MEAHLFHSGWASMWMPQPSSHSSAFSIFSGQTDVPWITDVSNLVKTGYFHIAILVISLLWTIASVRASQRIKVAPPTIKASQISVGHEICSQITRAAALAFTIVSALRGETRQWFNAALIGCAFILGLTRLANDLRWRHTALHQVNFLVGMSLLLLAAGDLLPTLELHSSYRPSDMEIGAISSLAAANIIAICTPREWAPPAISFELIQREAGAGPAPEETCSWFNLYLTFEWLTPLIWKGCRRQVEMDELPPLPWYDEPLVLLAWVQEARAKSRSTFWTFVRFMRKELSLMSFFSATSHAAELIAPFAMYQLLAYISDPEQAVLSPTIWLFLLFAGPMLKTVLFQQYIFTSTRLIVRVKAGMTQELYHRAMSSMELDGDILNDAKGKQVTANKTTHAGQLQNLMSGDIDAIWQARDVIMMGIGAPTGTILAFIGLYKLMGWPALVGSAIMVIAVPIPTYISQLMGKSQRQVKATQDARISLISEYLGSIKAIKYFAWEDATATIIDNARNAEQKVLWRISVLWVLMGQAIELMPMVSLVVMFTLYTSVVREPLTAQVAFTTLSLVSTMRTNLGMMGYFSRHLTNAVISLDRLDRYFFNTEPLVRYPEGPLRIEKARFKRNKKADFVLRDISIDFVEGGLTAVTGASGSGKTTLLLSILGETVKEAGEVTRPSDVAFASQTTWLQNASIKDNILFSSPFEEVRYNRIVEGCCLTVDFSELADGDETEVGENGTGLSGGQKARVALARALYSKAPLLLLDDIFSALDTKTSASVWELCFCSDMLKGRTVVLVTQHKWISQQADSIVVLENGTISSLEQNLGVVRKPPQLVKDAIDGEADDTPAESNGHETNGTTNGEAAKPSAESKPKKDDITKEMEATGRTGRLSFFQYMAYFGGPAYTVLAVFASVLGTSVYLLTTLWISVWVDAVNRGDAIDIGFYLGIYTAISCGAVVVDAFVYLIYANGGWQAARKLHARFIRSVMNVSLSWYKDTPTGRVVNRFSRDMASLDNQLSRLMQGTFELLVQLILRLGAISSIMPIFMLPGLISSAIGIIAGEMYTRTAVVVKRLVSSSQSPVFSQFADDMAGIQVIRARKDMAQNFGNLLAERLRSYNRATETNYNLNRWVAMRVDFVTAVVTVCAGIIAIVNVGVIPAGLVGFSLTNASALSQTILYLVRLANELEVEMQSFHRVKEYASLEPEEKTDADPHDPALVEYQQATGIPADWPRSGAIEFRNVTIRYDLDGPDILKDINLSFAAGERIAVVGRTGSGKSTLVLSLLRFTHVIKGQILYDGVDITLIPRNRLRRALTIIPQEAVLFNGTVGTNLDPSGEIAPEILESALDSCAGIASFRFRDRDSEAEDAEDGKPTNGDSLLLPPTEQTPLLDGVATPLAEAVAKSASGLSLSTTVDAKGENFSHGQRQVLSLCRALVRKSKLMLLDEATASMDPETDQGIQAVLRKEIFATGRDRTLVTIAHRLRTIADYDRVLVMGGGKVLEMGSPKELFEAKGAFYEMVQHSGEVQELQDIFETE
ncbi:ATP-binding cassette transporter abc4 [Cytospora mali]|uniref:ATP-binding cassette transporter abc4 n=1 Tax=Cytospora mali TaxID=578113 RepID=A0A194VXB9_CYTMA|nr:ATP-binding cassette transporter abc4 [Valsa mali]